MSFSSMPVLDLSQARNAFTKPSFLDSLRRALLEVGFLYIENAGISDNLIEDVINQGRAFFDLPEEKKLEVQMKNAPSFLGYNKLGNEITASKTDWREQIDLSTPHALPTSSDPLYYNLLAPNQWPDPAFLPSFRATFESYIRQMSTLSTTFTSLIAEALHLPPTAFDRFFDADQQHKLKIIKYPDTATLPEGQRTQQQGVGPHKDSMLTSYLLQASHHRGLQAQNLAGEWIDCPPIPGTLVVAIGQGLEALTRGVCASTTHRVISPSAGEGPRFSIPFFQGVSYDATFESVDVPEATMKMKEEIVRKRGGERRDDVEFTFTKGMWAHLGEATLVNRVRSHPDVGERWYPEILGRLREAERKGVSGEEDGREKRRVNAGAGKGGGADDWRSLGDSIGIAV
ncbi:MAG: hypothetical protein LQ345_002256 [Seirophora villosa]|nr:MAG: hypothetical protein LQ345_002256 [Seirophora villosa]